MADLAPPLNPIGICRHGHDHYNCHTCRAALVRAAERARTERIIEKKRDEWHDRAQAYPNGSDAYEHDMEMRRVAYLPLAAIRGGDHADA